MNPPSPMHPRRRRAVHTFVWMLLGMLCVQAAWCLAVPPFRGLDEHDHAYKAAAVARGDWSPHHEVSPEGWGDYVYVPRDLVQAATPVCESLSYTTPDNCLPGPARADGLVRVASSAASYDPVFYFVIGTVARPFHGVAALYAMRAASALLCALAVAAAVALTGCWARGRWPATIVTVTATPVLLYSSMVAAPNGIEMCAALLLWVSLIGLVRRAAEPPLPRVRRGPDPFLISATTAALPLVVVRSLGPLWLVLIVLTVLLVSPGPDVRSLLRRQARWLGAASVLVLLATAAAVAWTLSAGTNSVTTGIYARSGSPWAVVPQQLILWVLQSLGAFPARDEFAPLSLYMIGIALWGTLLVVTLRLADRRGRLAVLALVLVSCLVPVALLVHTFHQAGLIWQGRYGYPYDLGLIVLCALVVDRPARPPRLLGNGEAAPPAPTSVLALPSVAVGAAYAAMQLIGLVSVFLKQEHHSPLAGTHEWVRAPVAVLVLLVLVGATAQMWAAWRATPIDEPGSIGRPERSRSGGVATAGEAGAFASVRP